MVGMGFARAAFVMICLLVTEIPEEVRTKRHRRQQRLAREETL